MPFGKSVSKMSPRRRFPTDKRQSLTGTYDCDYSIKAILLGDLGVGKTAFLYTYINGHSPPNGLPYKLTKANVTKTVQYHGKRIKLNLWDTAGQERYRSLTGSYYRGAHACIVLYDVNNEESFDNVTGWLDSIDEFRDVSIPVTPLLVGLANTGRNSPKVSRDQRSGGSSVVRQRAETLASQYQIPHFQVDYETNIESVYFVMDSLIDLVMTKACGNDQMSWTIRPSSNTNLQASTLGWDHKLSKCVACCV